MRRELLARLAVLVEEMLSNTIQTRADPSGIRKLHTSPVVHHTEDVLPQNLVSAMTAWSAGQKRIQPTLHGLERELEPCDAYAHGSRGGQLTRTPFEESGERLGRNKTSVQQSLEALPNAVLRDLRAHQRNRFLLSCHAAKDP